MSRNSLRITGLRKSYGSNVVLNGVDLAVDEGRVHALLGANGAGKSTLLGCLSGATKPDSGVIRVGTDDHQAFTPRDAFEAGIAIIYQHFQLIGDLTVCDNIFLGVELRNSIGMIDRSAQLHSSAEVLSRLGVDIDPRTIVSELSVGQQQMVEIARAVRRSPEVLILDEPTAALGAHEVDALLELVQRLSREGRIAVIYVSHLLQEILRIADDITVLRDGEVLWTRTRDAVTLDDLVGAISPGAGWSAPGSRLLEEEITLHLDQLRCSFSGPIDIEVRRGEIVGVFGMLGAGRTNVLETIAGVEARVGGKIVLEGTPLNTRSPRRALNAGIALVASDRVAQSLFADLSAADNVLIPHLTTLARVGRSRRSELTEFVETAELTCLSPPDPAMPARSFSGGNAQKLAVGRWTTRSAKVKVLLLDEPTQGVDIGSRQDLYQLLRTVAETGVSIVFASSDPEEIIALADRVLVLVEGQVSHLGANNLSEQTLTKLALPGTSERAS